MMAKVFRHVVGDRERGQRAASHQKLLADLDDLDELGRIRVEVHHVPCFASGLGAGVHGDADIGLGECGRVIGAVAAHGDELALGLLLANEPQLFLGRGLGQEIVDAGFGGDCRRGNGIVARDHDGANAHTPQFGKTLADAAFDDVLQMNDAEQFAILGDGERRAAGLRNGVGDRVHLARDFGADIRPQRLYGVARCDGRGPIEKIQDRIHRAFTDPGRADLDAAHPRLRGRTG